MAKKLNNEDFLIRIKAIHGDKYDFSKTVYKLNRLKVVATCPIHGDFEILPSNFLAGRGCRKCGHDNIRKNQDTFISELIAIHGDKYLYDKIVYVSDSRKVTVTCPIHGDFEITPNSLLRGSGCAKCNNKPLEEWTKAFKVVHEDFYSYNKIPYVLARSPITVTCPIHGDFEILPNNHLKGVGCPECFVVHNKFTKEDFVTKVSSLHNNFYDYSDSVYLGYSEFIDITCPVHGVFTQKAFSHASGHGCPKCFGKISKPEFEIVNFLKTLGLNDSQILMSNSPDFMPGKQQLDIYLPDFKFAIEFNGSRWHSENHGKSNNYHFEKWKACNEAGVVLLTIWDFNWGLPLKANIYKSKIRHFLKMDNRVYGRKTVIRNIDKDVAILFVQNNHLEGMGIPYKDSKFIGLFEGENLLMVAIYGMFYSQSSSSYTWKLQRVATLTGYTVVGGISKINSFIKKDVGSFQFQITLDTGGTIGNYFSRSSTISLRYWWVNSKMIVKSRNSTQVSILKKNLDWIEGDTESSYMIRNGFYKVFDCGIATLIN